MVEIGGVQIVHQDIETIKQWLKRYGEIYRYLETLYNRYEVLEQNAISPRSLINDGMPHSKSISPDHIGNSLAILDELKESIQEQQIYAKEVYNEINQAINQLRVAKCNKWADKKCVLLCRYLDLMNYSEIAELLFGKLDKYWDNPDTYLRRTHKLHKAALEELAELVPINSIQEKETEGSDKDENGF